MSSTVGYRALVFAGERVRAGYISVAFNLPGVSLGNTKTVFAGTGVS